MFNRNAKLKKGGSKESSTFVTAALKEQNKTLSGNGALKYESTGDSFVDQFGQVSTYRQLRTFENIASDMEILWAEDKLKAVKFTIYLRMITRVTMLPDGSKTKTSQAGAELKHEAIMRMLWIYMKHESAFWNNIMLFIAAGSWKDMFELLRYDLLSNTWEGRKLNWDNFFDLIEAGLKNEQHSELIKKYLPTIVTNRLATTNHKIANNMIGKWLVSKLFDTSEENKVSSYKRYRQLKSSGTAHEWQQLISRKEFSKLDFSKIHGRALSLLVKGKFLKNQGLSEVYNEWISDDAVETVKFTGFVAELFTGLPKQRLSLDDNRKQTIIKQFAELVRKGGESEAPKFIVVRDTSGSMSSLATGMKISSGDVAKSIALFFSEFLTGKFADSWIEFAYSAKLHQWKGDNVVDKFYNDKSSYIGGTNFQSVIDLFVALKNKGIPEEEFPTGILCISDGEFNPSDLNETNIDTARKKLRNNFSKEFADNFVIALWNIHNGYYGTDKSKFETFGDAKNVFYMSGYNATIVKFLTSKVSTARELLEEALNQELLKGVEL